MNERLINLAGKKFGKLSVIEFAYRQNKASHFKCICECGNITYVSSQNLRKGHSSSCGCSKGNFITEKKTTHGMCGTRIYRIWANMLNRCYRKTHHNYKYYGALGIKVCKRWHKFEKFYEDTKEGYADSLSLDRKRHRGNYAANNYRWATKTEQARNTKANVFLEYNGEKLTHAEWAERLGFNSALINHRVSYGWSTEKILTKPVRKILKL